MPIGSLQYTIMSIILVDDVLAKIVERIVDHNTICVIAQVSNQFCRVFREVYNAKNLMQRVIIEQNIFNDVIIRKFAQFPNGVQHGVMIMEGDIGFKAFIFQYHYGEEKTKKTIE